MKKQDVKTNKGVKRTDINESVLIEQITEHLWDTATKEELFDVSNIVLGTHLTTETHRLVQDMAEPSPSTVPIGASQRP